MSLELWIAIGFSGIFTAVFILPKLWRAFLEHCFREYNHWQRHSLPKSIVRISHVDFDENGEVSIGLEYSEGMGVVECHIREPIETVAKRLMEFVARIPHSQKQQIGILEFGGVILSFDLPLPTSQAGQA